VLCWLHGSRRESARRRLDWIRADSVSQRSNFYADQSGMRRQLSLLQKLIQVMDPAVYAHLESTDSLHLFFCFRCVVRARTQRVSEADAVCADGYLSCSRWAARTTERHSSC
jgi:hypothetical protein